MSNLKNHLSKNELFSQENSFDSIFKEYEKRLHTWTPEAKSSEGFIDVIDFFSGCGGMTFGFSLLSDMFNLKGAIDINEIALDSYKNNFKTKTSKQDIQEIIATNKFDMLCNEFGISEKRERPLVVIGCAPCQGFTSHRKKNWDSDDSRNTLIGAFTEVAIKLSPDYIIMENVPEILGKKYWAHYSEARDIFEKSGYQVSQTIYNSASFGVPQSRFRAIIVASKKKFSLPAPVYANTEFKTVKDAIGNLKVVEAGEVDINDSMHKSAKHKQSTIDTIKAVPKDGGKRPKGVGPQCLDKVSGYSDVYGRLYWEKPSITLTQYARNPASGRFSHPEQNRGLTIREAARLQSFPDGYMFSGSLDKSFKQIGESVPPLLSLALALQVVIDAAEIDLKASKLSIAEVTNPVSSSFSSVIASLKKVI